MKKKKNAIFIAATGQNVGKTTLCLGIIAALKKRFSSVGFIKPVGQRHVKVDGHINVDKDAVLFKQHFQLPTHWADISPVIIPSGFTRSYLDQEITEEAMLKTISSSFKTISSQHPYTVVEGTGHVGVGSIFNLNNARVAAELNLGIIMIASAGLGSAYDELALNIAMCKHYGVAIQGVILNRVMDSKRQMIMDYFPKTLKKWKIPLLGCVPYSEMLSNPTMVDFETLFETNLLSGHEHHYRNFDHIRLVAGSLEAYEAEMQANELVITPASRDDIIAKIVLQHHISAKEKSKGTAGGIILTSKQAPSDQTIKLLKTVDIPVLYTPLCSYDVMKIITSFTAKIRTEDHPKINRAIKLVEENIDFRFILQ